MDVRAFADELLPALANTGLFEQVSLQTEGPIANGYAYVDESLFLRFYFNAVTGTTALPAASISSPLCKAIDWSGAGTNLLGMA